MREEQGALPGATAVVKTLPEARVGIGIYPSPTTPEGDRSCATRYVNSLIPSSVHPSTRRVY